MNDCKIAVRDFVNVTLKACIVKLFLQQQLKLLWSEVLYLARLHHSLQILDYDRRDTFSLTYNAKELATAVKMFIESATEGLKD
jgi:hypothetical protein